jgi:hypothetical protein
LSTKREAFEMLVDRDPGCTRLPSHCNMWR